MLQQLADTMSVEKYKNTKLEFDEIFKISILAFKLNRAHPAIPRNAIWAVHFLVVHGTFSMVFAALVYSILYYMQNNNVSEACASGIMSVVFIVVSMKHFITTWCQNLFIILMDRVKYDFTLANSLSSVEKNLVIQYALKGKWVTKIWLLISAIISISFPLKTMFLMVYYAVIDQFRLVPIFDSFHPKIMEKTENFTFFVVLYLLSVFYDVYANIMYTAFAPMGPIFMLHACGQLEVVKSRVQTLFPEGYDPEKTKARLKDIVQRLQNIYEFVEIINTTFKLFYEFLLRATSVFVPLIVYLLIEDFKHGRLSMEYITFIFGGFVISFIPCYYSNLLMEKGEEVRQAVYSSGWDKSMDSRARSTILIVMARATRSVAVRTVFRTVDLAAFSDVCKSAYAIFNILNTMWG